MAIVLHASSSQPNDNGTYTTSPLVITPPTQMQVGDLVFVTVCQSSTTGTISVSASGGQTWTSLTQRNATRNRARSFWCVFNGTWTADPSFVTVSGANGIGRMLVFRPDGGTASTWVVDAAESSATYSAPTTPFTVTIPAISTATPGALVIAGWTSADDNTWGSLTSGWTELSPAQIRNTSGTYDESQTHAYKIQAASGSTGDVAQNQATLGGDAGTRIIIAFREVKSPTVAQYVQAVLGETADPVLSGSAVKTPDAIAMSADQPEPSVFFGNTQSPEPIAGAFSMLDPAMQGPRTVQPDHLEAASDQTDVVVVASALKVPDAVAMDGSQPSPVTSGSAVRVPDHIEGAATTPAPSVNAGDFPDATAEVDALVGHLALASEAGVEVDAIHVAAEITAEAGTVTPGYVGVTTGAVAVTPEPIECVAETTDQSILARALVAIQAAIQAVFQTLAPAMAGALLYVVEPVVLAADQPEPTVIAGAVITPDPIAATAEIDDTLVLSGAAVAVPSPVVGTFSAADEPDTSIEARAVVGEVSTTGELIDPSPVLGGDVLVPVLETVDALASVVAPWTALVTVDAPEPVAGEFSCPDNAFRISHVESVSPVAAESATLTPVVRPQNIVTRQDWPIPSYLELCEPTLSISSAPILIQEALDVTASQPVPVVRARAVVAVEPIAATLDIAEPTLGTAGNVTVQPGAVAGAFSAIDGAETAEALVECEPFDAAAEPVDPAVATALETAVPVEPVGAAGGLLAPEVVAEALIEPEPIDAEASVTDETVTATALVALDHIDAEVDQPEPSLATAGNITVRPDPITGHLAAADAPETSVDSTAVVSEIGGTFDQPEPMVWNTPVTVEPEAIEGEFSQPTPAVGSAVNWTFIPDPIAGEFTAASEPSAAISPLVVVAEVEAAGSVTVTGFGAGAQVVPSPITGTFTPQTTRVVSQIISATVSPQPIAAVGSVSYFEFSIDAELVPIENDAAASQPTPSVALQNSPTVIPAPLTATGTVGTPATLVNGAIWLWVDAITGAFSPVEPVVGREHTASAGVVSGEFSLPAPHVAIGDTESAAVTPDALAATAAQPTPTVAWTTSVTVAVSPVTAQAEQPTPQVRLPRLVAVYLPNTAMAETVAPSALINSALVVPPPITGTLEIVSPIPQPSSELRGLVILRDVFGSERMVDVRREDRIRSSEVRERIFDIHIGRR